MAKDDYHRTKDEQTARPWAASWIHDACTPVLEWPAENDADEAEEEESPLAHADGLRVHVQLVSGIKKTGL